MPGFLLGLGARLLGGLIGGKIATTRENRHNAKSRPSGTYGEGVALVLQWAFVWIVLTIICGTGGAVVNIWAAHRGYQTLATIVAVLGYGLCIPKIVAFAISFIKGRR